MSSLNSSESNNSDAPAPHTPHTTATSEFTPREIRARATHTSASSHRYAWLCVAFAMFVMTWGGNEFTPLLIFYRNESVFSPVFVDSLLGSYATGIMIGLIFLGPLSDRYGRKTVMLGGPVAAILGSALIAIGEKTELPMFTGRFLAGLAVGIAMTVGGSWVKELSQAPFDPHAKPSSGAGRAAMALTSGLGLGAGMAGVLAQWGPIPGQLSYLVHITLSIPALLFLVKTPETRQSAHLNVHGSFWSDLAVPTVKHPRFLTVVVPMAPWGFGAAGVAYAVTPALMSSHVGAPVAYSSLLTVVCLAFGFGIQKVGGRINTARSARGPIIGIIFVAVGMALAAFVSTQLTIIGTLTVAALLGLGYGLVLISGLIEVQRLAGPDDLAGLTSVFYALTYVGFFFPMILTKLSGRFDYVTMLGFGAVEATLTLIFLVMVSRKNVPTTAETTPPSRH
ncbi:MFS transporter [Corynebacterium kroppenstedtii]|uniref:MFS transporter n=1 Tax=Corynebacterium sp. PCR 32 TaxID=3351342 RepID=UPI0030A3F856